MKLRYLPILTFTCACSFLQAQEVSQVEEIQGRKVIAVSIPNYAVKQAPSALLTESYVAKGYCTDNVQCQVGFSEKEQLGAAIFVPRDMLGIYKDAEVVGLRIGLGAEASEINTFLIEGNDFEAAHKLSTQFPNPLGPGIYDIMFRVPYQIVDNLIVGYTSIGTNQIGMDGEQAYENASYIQRKGEWGSIYKSAVQNKFGALSIQLLLTGENMPENEMAIGEILTEHAEQGKAFTLKGIAKNQTTKSAVENYEVTCTFDNGYSTTQTIEKYLAASQTDTFSIAIEPQIRYGSTLATVEITKVNGEIDSDPSNNATMKVLNIVEKGCYFPRMVVAEEGTSTYCGYCPRGIVVLESMKKRYPDTFIGIAVHTDAMGIDPMHSQSYNDISDYFKSDGLPNGVVNRKKKQSGDPLFFEQYYDDEKGKLSDAQVVIRSVSNVQENSEKGKIIHVESEITFARTMSNANYKLAYVLLEHEVAGQQMNSFAGGGQGSMAGWENKPQLVDMLFNDVARDIWDLRGMNNSLPSEIEKKVTYKHSFDMPLPITVENENNLEVVVMVLDANQGEEIIQAAKLGIGKETGISTPAITHDIDGWNIYAENRTVKMLGVENATIAVYNMDGRQVRNDNLPNGIYLVRATANGKTLTSKVVIR